MRITKLQWLPDIIEKLAVKHGVETSEVVELFRYDPLIRRGPKGKRKGENVYVAYGRTESGRYLIVFFIHKLDQSALIMSARDMDDSERRLYQRG